MGQLKLNCEIEDDIYGKPSLYKVYVDTDRGYNAGMSWFYYDMWIKRGDEWIYRFFECPNKVINEVKLGYESFIEKFINSHDFPHADTVYHVVTLTTEKELIEK